jgi:ABC-type multidrug transport system fused ATPase/permease subunit
VEPGRITAVVSASPSASAGVAERLARLTAAADGDDAALLGGVPVDRLPREVLRRRVVLADADPQLFTGRVRGQLDPHRRHDDDAVLRAVGTAAAHDVLDGLPRGLDDEVSERGRSLSGGQRQRLALARALVRQPAILLLDEATSALDTITEQQVQQALASLRCTRIVIAQRLSTIAQADRILVMDQGCIVEQGTHVELIGQQGLYAELVAAQRVA